MTSPLLSMSKLPTKTKKGSLLRRMGQRKSNMIGLTLDTPIKFVCSPRFRRVRFTLTLFFGNY